MRASAKLRALVEGRAKGRCEYCLIHQTDVLFSHELDHVRSQKHSGRTVLANLAFACAECNGFKGSDLVSYASDESIVRFFDPRRDNWDDHFVIVGSRIEPRTSTGEVTVRIFRFNIERRTKLRAILQRQGRFPIGETG